jgi:hypothetical protein
LYFLFYWKTFLNCDSIRFRKQNKRKTKQATALASSS